ncbi:MAG: EAL domain-containing protein [Gammaproteobacteria bacterium]|nr:EAL domain-containing protein [Gammaproteobacteria bacterium]
MHDARHVAAGSVLFREGEPGEAAYIIEQGRVEVSLRRNGHDVVVAELGPGDLLGEMALLDAGTRSATATAVEATTVAAIHRDQLDAAMNAADPVIKLFLRVLLERFHEANARLHGDGDAPRRPSRALREDLDAAVGDLHLRDELLRALERAEFALHYPPIVELVSGHVAGYEALIRWNHPERGLVGPFEFIGFAEKSGLIAEIGQWVLEEACAAACRLDGSGPAGAPFVTLNVSPRQLASDDFIDRAGACLQASSIDPRRIKLEMTESLLLEDPQRAAEQLAEMKMLGVRLALDDFGTGYSSLSYLHRYPFDTLKIDRSFVTTMLRSGDSMEIVRCILGMAEALMLDVVAEGIESDDELSMLAGLGCAYGQGYHFARPLPEAEAFSILTR